MLLIIYTSDRLYMEHYRVVHIVTYSLELMYLITMLLKELRSWRFI